MNDRKPATKSDKDLRSTGALSAAERRVRRKYRDVHKENMRKSKEMAEGAGDEGPDDDDTAAANWLEAENNSEFENGSDEGHTSSEEIDAEQIKKCKKDSGVGQGPETVQTSVTGRVRESTGAAASGRRPLARRMSQSSTRDSVDCQSELPDDNGGRASGTQATGSRSRNDQGSAAGQMPTEVASECDPKAKTKATGLGSGAGEAPERPLNVAPAPTPQPEAVSNTPRGVHEVAAGEAAPADSVKRESSTGLFVGAGRTEQCGRGRSCGWQHSES